MRKKVPLYLHIGLHKTGTTYIQSVLARNRAYLARNGVLFPRAGYGVGTSTFKKRGLVSAGHAAFVKAVKNQTVAGTLKKRLRKEVESLNVDKVIISAENLDNPFGRSRPAMVKKLFRQYDVHIVVYLRRVDDWVESHYKQVMTAHHHRFHDTLDVLVESQYAQALDFFGRIERWVTRFGSGKMHVRVYDEARRADGGILGDFLATVGSAELMAGIDTDIDAVNASYGREIVEACRLFKAANQDVPDFTEKMKSFINELQDVVHEEDRMRILSPAQRRSLSDKWEDNAVKFVEAGFLSAEQYQLLLVPDISAEVWRELPSLPEQLRDLVSVYSSEKEGSKLIEQA